MSDAWFDDASSGSPSPAASPKKTPVKQPHPPPGGDDESAPAWLTKDTVDDDDDDIGTSGNAAPDAAGTSGEPKKQPKKHRGGEVIDVDVVGPAANKGGNRAAAPATFMARMAQFEQHREKREPKKSKPSSTSNNNAKKTPVKQPRKNGSTAIGKCPTPPSEASPGKNSASPRRKAVAQQAVIGENAGLSEASRTQPVSLNDFLPLSDDEKMKFAKELTAFGHDAIARSRAPLFQLRLAALSTVRSVFDELYTTGPIPAMEAIVPLLARLAADTVPKVAAAACEVFEYVLSQALFITESTLEQLTPLLRALCHQLRDGRSKVYTAAKSGLQRAAAHDSIGPVPVVEELCTYVEHRSTGGSGATAEDEERAAERLAATLNSTMTATTSGINGSDDGPLNAVFKARVTALGGNWKALGSRLDVCLTMLQEYPSAVHGCTDAIMALGVAGLNCANSRVRRTAVVFTTEVYRTLRDAAEPYLKLVGAANTMKLLREEIDIEIGDDGDPAAAAAGAGIVASTSMAATAEAREEDQDLAAFDAEEVPAGHSEKLTAEQREQLAFWAETLPQVRSLRCVFSSAWRLRKRALDRVLAQPLLFFARRTDEGEVSYTSGPSEREAAELLTAASAKNVPAIDLDRAAVALSQVVEATLGQHIPAVASSSFDIAAGALFSARWSTEQKRTLGIPLTPIVLRFAAHDKVSDASPLAQHFLHGLAHVPPPATVPSAMAAFAVKSDSAIGKMAGKLVAPRTQCLQMLIDGFGTSGTGIDPDAVMKFAVEALRHPQSRVRRGGVDLVLAVYKAAGNVVQEYLSQLAGPILDEVKERIQAMAAKDRSRTAPSRRLATIVGGGDMLSPNGSEASPKGGLAASPERPSTIGASPPGAAGRKGPEFARTQGTSLRQRMTEWRDAQQADPTLADTPSPVGKKNASTSNASPSGVRATSAQPNKGGDASPSPGAGAAVPQSAPPGAALPGSSTAVFQAPAQRKGHLVFA